MKDDDVTVKASDSAEPEVRVCWVALNGIDDTALTASHALLDAEERQRALRIVHQPSGPILTEASLRSGESAQQVKDWCALYSRPREG